MGPGVEEVMQMGVKVSEFPVLYSGWECDHTAFVYDYKGQLFLILSNHGAPYIADLSDLREKIEEYEEVLAASRKALNDLLRSWR